MSLPPVRPGTALVLGIAAALAPLVAVAAPLGIAPLFVLAALAVVMLDGRAFLGRLRMMAPLAVLLSLLSLWCMLSAVWSIVPLHSFLEGLRLLAIAAGGMVLLCAGAALADDARRRVALGAAIGVALAAALLLFEARTDAALTRFFYGGERIVLMTRFDRSSTTLVLALWPALGIARARWRLVGWLLAAAVLTASLALQSEAAVLGLGVGFVVFAAALLVPRLMAAALALGIAGLAVALPIATPSDRAVVALHHDAPWIKESGIHRLLIWRFTADRIAERPILGWGMDAARALPGGTEDFGKTLPESGVSPGSEALPLHPHDAILEWEVELGVPGTLFCLAIVGWGLWRAAADARMLAWAATALVIGLLSYGAWQAWWLACLLLTASFLAATVPREDAPRRLL